MTPEPALAERFATRLRDLMGEKFVAEGRLGLAVSGGTDSLALALLASAAMPGRVAAATLDHGLQAQSAAWAEQTGALCRTLGIPHHVLTIEWPEGSPTANRQALAREARYERLGAWLVEQGLDHLATAHHLDDQAETLIMRLDRGAGVGGLAGVRARRLLLVHETKRYDCVRPLLFARRAELERLVSKAQLSPIDDPANRDPAHDRTGARSFLSASPDYPDRARLAKSAAYLGEADRALEWAALELSRSREHSVDDGYEIDVSGVPAELRRRMVLNCLKAMGIEAPRGDVLTRALDRLGAGEVATLSNIVIRPRGELWRFEPAPPRRDCY